MNKQKIKEFWEKHKTAIVAGTMAGIGGVCLGCVMGKPSKFERKLMNDLKGFGKGTAFLKDLNNVQAGSDYAQVVLGHSDNRTINSCIDALKEFYAEQAIDLDSEATGMVMFLKTEQ